MSNHIEENLLERYAMGLVPEQLLAELEEHLLACPDCQSRLMQLDQFLAAFRQAAPGIQTQPAPLWTRFRFLVRPAWLAPAAALAAGLLFVVLKPGAPPVAPAIVQMQALRGPEIAAQLAAGKPALLVFDVRDAETTGGFEVEVVDLNGKPVLALETEAKDGRLSVPVPKLGRGSYWVRVYRGGPERRLLEEYALRAR